MSVPRDKPKSVWISWCSACGEALEVWAQKRKPLRRETTAECSCGMGFLSEGTIALIECKPVKCLS